MSDEISFAEPAFKPDEALQRLQRDLRALGLAERNGQFERRGVAMARANVVADFVVAARVRRPSRSSPEWLTRELCNAAQVRDFVADLRRQLSLWNNTDD